jgi:hypothetical protein
VYCIITRKASTGLKKLSLSLSSLNSVNFDELFEPIFSLDHLAFLSLNWDRISIEKIKLILNKQDKKKKKLQFLSLYRVDRDISESDILEICSFLPELKCLGVQASQSFDLTVDGAKEWKRICPQLESVKFGDELSEEVEEALNEMGVET